MSDFKAKMHQTCFPLGLYPGGAYSILAIPLVVFKEPTSKEGEGRGGVGKER